MMRSTQRDTIFSLGGSATFMTGETPNHPPLQVAFAVLNQSCALPVTLQPNPAQNEKKNTETPIPITP